MLKANAPARICGSCRDRAGFRRRPFPRDNRYEPPRGRPLTLSRHAGAERDPPARRFYSFPSVTFTNKLFMPLVHTSGLPSLKKTSFVNLSGIAAPAASDAGNRSLENIATKRRTRNRSRYHATLTRSEIFGHAVSAPSLRSLSPHERFDPRAGVFDLRSLDESIVRDFPALFPGRIRWIGVPLMHS
jgi:hypothetical protein